MKLKVSKGWQIAILSFFMMVEISDFDPLPTLFNTNYRDHPFL